MKRLKQHWRGILRILATILICAGMFCGYWWLYKLAPSRRTLDPKWYASRSQQEYWHEVQKGIHRGMWFHDDGFTVGWYGDKSWAEWIMAHVRPGDEMGCLGGEPCHSATSMRYITNQDAGEDADAWLQWWEQNRYKNQEEWIADGFRRRGFEVDVPPATSQIPVLLALLGNSKTDESEVLPEEIKYNAFRCLRDSTFEPIAFALDNPTMSEELKRGLLEYTKQEHRWPSAIGVGILPFGMKESNWEDTPLPRMLEPDFQIMANALVFGSSLLGLALLILSFKKTRKFEQKDAEGPPIVGPRSTRSNCIDVRT